jgi:hypothetical protein
MTDFNEIIQAIVAVFIIVLLGYVFTLVFWELSPILAVVFAIVLVIVVIGMLFQILKR